MIVVGITIQYMWGGFSLQNDTTTMTPGDKCLLDGANGDNEEESLCRVGN